MTKLTLILVVAYDNNDRGNQERDVEESNDMYMYHLYDRQFGVETFLF